MDSNANGYVSCPRSPARQARRYPPSRDRRKLRPSTPTAGHRSSSRSSSGCPRPCRSCCDTKRRTCTRHNFCYAILEDSQPSATRFLSTFGAAKYTPPKHPSAVPRPTLSPSRTRSSHPSGRFRELLRVRHAHQSVRRLLGPREQKRLRSTMLQLLVRSIEIHACVIVSEQYCCGMHACIRV